MAYWSVYCMENEWPGLWRRWEQLQAVTVGWPPGRGWHYDGSGTQNPGWSEVRNQLALMQEGDAIVARLPDHRIGRIGKVVDVRVTDGDWCPVIKPSQEYPYGEQGRRIEVRWDFTVGPPDREWACTLPPHARLSPGKLRRTIVSLEEREFESLKKALANPANWAPVAGRFLYERGLRDFIATFPERLEARMRLYPMRKPVEYPVTPDDRIDVLLQDEHGKPVVVECKRGAASVDHVKQLQRYMKQVEQRIGEKPRGILAFGGCRNVGKEVSEAAKEAAVELFAYRLEVRFERCPV